MCLALCHDCQIRMEESLATHQPLYGKFTFISIRELENKHLQGLPIVFLTFWGFVFYKTSMKLTSQYTKACISLGENILTYIQAILTNYFAHSFHFTKIFYYFKIMYGVLACGYVPTEASGARSPGPGGLTVVSHLPWVVGTGCGSSGRAARALDAELSVMLHFPPSCGTSLLSSPSAKAVSWVCFFLVQSIIYISHISPFGSLSPPSH